MKAVILAAGEGSRMNGSGSHEHKALERIIGIPIIERGILALRDAGVSDIAIVVGHAAAALREELGDGSRMGVTLSYAQNSNWQRGNGTSLYAARDFTGDSPFIVVMADHWFDPRIASVLLEKAEGIDYSLLCVDSRIDSPHDPGEATKVTIDEIGRIRSLGKDLTSVDALDCGIFLFTPEIYRALEAAFAGGEFTVSAGATNLAARGRLAAVQVGDLLWEDVDTKPELKSARSKLLKSLSSRDDGIVSRYFNRRLSVHLTVAACWARLTPNLVSLFSFLTAIAAGILFGMGQLIPGAIATQASSVMDGTDGEVARARFMASRRGALLDSILDRLADGIILAGVAYHILSNAAGPREIIVISAAIVVAPMSMMIKDRFQLATGLKWESRVDDGAARLLLASRDGRLFIVFVGGLVGHLTIAMTYLAVTGVFLLAWRLVIAWRRLSPEPAMPDSPQVMESLVAGD